MPASLFETAVRQRDGAFVIDLHGDIDGQAGPMLDAVYTEVAGSAAERVLLNFTSVGYINSTGIALIVGLLARARADGRPIVAFGLDDHYREIFTITRLSDFMTLYPDEEAAVTEHPAAV